MYGVPIPGGEMLDWETAAADSLEIPAGEIHVWAFELDSPGQHVAELEVLNEQESTRAARYHFERHRRRFAVCRARQRQILAAYLGSSPAELQFEYSPLGKPSIAAEMNPHALEFNVTNSAELGLLAIARNTPLGVDVEHLRPLPSGPGIAKRFFCPAERERFPADDAPEFNRVFFRHWTAKEAMIKATGKGLTTPLNEVEILVTGEPAEETIRLVSLCNDSPQAWTLLPLVPASDYIAAVATRSAVSRTVCRKWA